MVVLITGSSHTGKTLLAQALLNKYQYPYLSIDLLKMGLIRSGNTNLTPADDQDLEAYLWPIVREIIKTAIENRQNLIVEGCYIPSDWKGFKTERTYRGTLYKIEVKHESGAGKGVTRIEVDGKPWEGKVVFSKEKECQVTVWM